jgi:hypothetical protein
MRAVDGIALMVRTSTRPWPRSAVQSSTAIDRQHSASAASNSLGWFSPIVILSFRVSQGRCPFPAWPSSTPANRQRSTRYPAPHPATAPPPEAAPITPAIRGHSSPARPRTVPPADSPRQHRSACRHLVPSGNPRNSCPAGCRTPPAYSHPAGWRTIARTAAAARGRRCRRPRARADGRESQIRCRLSR